MRSIVRTSPSTLDSFNTVSQLNKARNSNTDLLNTQLEYQKRSAAKKGRLLIIGVDFNSNRYNIDEFDNVSDLAGHSRKSYFIDGSRINSFKFYNNYAGPAGHQTVSYSNLHRYLLLGLSPLRQFTKHYLHRITDIRNLRQQHAGHPDRVRGKQLRILYYKYRLHKSDQSGYQLFDRFDHPLQSEHQHSDENCRNFQQQRQVGGDNSPADHRRLYRRSGRHVQYCP